MSTNGEEKTDRHQTLNLWNWKLKDRQNSVRSFTIEWFLCKCRMVLFRGATSIVSMFSRAVWPVWAADIFLKFLWSSSFLNSERIYYYESEAKGIQCGMWKWIVSYIIMHHSPKWARILLYSVSFFSFLSKITYVRTFFKSFLCHFFKLLYSIHF